MKIIYLDMDDTLVQWTAAACALMGVPYNRRDHDSDIRNLTGTDMDAIWDKIVAEGVNFWASLEPYPWFKELYDICEEYGDVLIATNPAASPRQDEAMAGKILWLERMFGKGFNKYVFTKHKHLLANSNTILVDDFQGNRTKFAKHGGAVVPVYPRQDDPLVDIRNAFGYLKFSRMPEWSAIGD